MTSYEMKPIKKLLSRGYLKDPFPIRAIEIAYRLGFLSRIKREILVKIKKKESLEKYIENNINVIEDLINDKIIIEC